MKWPRLRRHHRELPEFLNVPWSGRDILVFVILWMGVQIGLFLWMGVLAPFVPVVADATRLIKDGNPAALFVTDILDAVVGLGLVWWYLHRYKVGWKAVGWRKLNVLKTLKYIFIIFIVFMVAANLLLMLDPFYEFWEPSHNPCVCTFALTRHRPDVEGHELVKLSLDEIVPMLEGVIAMRDRR